MNFTILIIALLLMAGCGGPQDKADVFLSQGDFTRAARYYNKALEKSPKNRDVRLGLGKALLQKAIYLQENNRDSGMDWEFAVNELNIAQQMAPDAECEKLLGYARFVWAKKIMAGGDTLLAVRKLEQLLTQDYKNTDARNFLAIVCHNQGNRQRAVDLLMENTVLDSSDATARYNLGMLFWQEEDYLNAYDWWVKAFTLEPEDSDIAYWMLQAEKKLK